MHDQAHVPTDKLNFNKKNQRWELKVSLESEDMFNTDDNAKAFSSFLSHSGNSNDYLIGAPRVRSLQRGGKVCPQACILFHTVKNGVVYRFNAVNRGAISRGACLCEPVIDEKW